MKARAADVTLETGNQTFEVTGARATAASEGLPLLAQRPHTHTHTHTLYDPVAYKQLDVGRWVVQGELPEPTWYSRPPPERLPGGCAPFSPKEDPWPPSCRSPAALPPPPAPTACCVTWTSD
ncbi:hypothetical protein TNCT1_35150 [Streptomyces sp. 1-11]|nr:hypothetical protein TNCT1_35150 [Streptomyces sp. 1-11]